MKKKLISFVLVIIFGVIFLSFHVFSSNQLNAVALGDSITTGYGLSDDEKNYVNIIGDEYNFNIVNLANNGDTTAMLLQHLKEEKYREQLKKSNIIFLDIGSNDVLQSFLDCIADSLAIKDKSGDLSFKISSTIQNDPIKAYTLLPLYFQEGTPEYQTLNEKLNGYLKQFDSNYRDIINTIQEIAPESRIIILNIYNPFKGIQSGQVNFDKASDAFIQNFNEVIAKVANESGLNVVDIHTAFETYEGSEPLTKSDIATANLDPHPTAAGQRLIAKFVKTALK